MASDSEPLGIDFALSSQQQAVRLIELPPALLQAIESGETVRLIHHILHIILPTSTHILSPIRIQTHNPQLTSHTQLYLKSQNANNAASSAVLCSSSKTFSIRQNQSSNSLFITQALPLSPSPSPSSPSTSTSTTSSPPPPVTALVSVARPSGMLEITPHTASAVAYLRSVLPVAYTPSTASSYTHPPPSDAETTGSKRHMPLSAHQRLAPFSAAEFGTAAAELNVFELTLGFGETPVAWITGWKTLLRTWEDMFGSIREPAPPPLDADGSAVWVVDFGLVEGHMNWVVAKITVGGEGDEEEDEEEETVSIDAARCVKTVGELVLQAELESEDERERREWVDREELLEKWRRLLPSAWDALVKMENLTVPVTEEGGRVRLKGADEGAKRKATQPLSKWHEKLKASRRA